MSDRESIELRACLGEEALPVLAAIRKSAVQATISPHPQSVQTSPRPPTAHRALHDQQDAKLLHDLLGRRATHHHPPAPPPEGGGAGA
ncbi:hypothetical protein [Rhodococcus sp. 21391]|uniref:hypothetical protein n=1 Tax=Rhodococcus sp. 21391 TaxID=2683591 RepID=UPI00192AE4B0|nr:hypothetical protein [Rhodococcus sp. 21391]QQZ16021.1 hypothetical protein GO592_07505 [Rhodococcus sp. 21391]